MRNVVGRLRRHSWLAAYLGLFVALSTGGAYAVDKIGSKEIAKSAVKSKHVKNRGIKNRDLADDAVTAERVLDGSLLGSDFADGQLPQGKQGPQGPIGPKGPVGPAGATNVVVREATSTPGTAIGISENVSKSCQPGEVATGGGAFPINVPNLDVEFVRTNPVPASEGLVPTGWSGTLVTSTNDPDGVIRTFVVCASP